MTDDPGTARAARPGPDTHAVQADQAGRELRSWCERAETTLQAVLDKPAFQQVRAPWRSRLDDDRLHVAVVGPYDSGKSSLILRLLLEEGIAPPESLRISGKPETGAVTGYPCGNLVLYDTPGLGAANPAHRKAALAAAELADCVVVVVPPQGATGTTRDLLDVVRRCMDSGIALVHVVAQTDTAGVDPEDDPEGFVEQRELRKKEVLDLFSAAGIPAAAQVVHTVAATPDASAAVPGPGEPGDPRGWDGIAGLRADLTGLVKQRPALRVRSGLLYWTVTVDRTLAQVQARAEVVRRQITDGEDARRRVECFHAELDALIAAAHAELRSAIRVELQALTLAADDTAVAELGTAVTVQLGQLLHRWHLEWGNRVRELAARASIEPGGSPAGKPGVSLDDAWIRSLIEGALSSTASTGALPLDRLTSLLGTAADKLVDRVVERSLGVPLPQARAEVSRAKKLTEEQWEPYRLSEGMFRDREHLEKFSETLKDAEAVAAVLPVAVEGAGMILSSVLARWQEGRALERRRQLDKAVDDAAGALADRITQAPHWAGPIEELRTAISAQAPTPRELDDAAHLAKRLAEHQRELEALMLARPAPR